MSCVPFSHGFLFISQNLFQNQSLVPSFQDKKIPEFCNYTVNGTRPSMNLNFKLEVQGERKGLREFMYIAKAFCSPLIKFLDLPLAIAYILMSRCFEGYHL